MALETGLLNLCFKPSNFSLKYNCLIKNIVLRINKGATEGYGPGIFPGYY